MLWPERFDEKRLHENRRRLGSYSFAALYQQQPVPAEGGFFKRHWFRIADFPPPGLKWKRGYDLGISTAQTADYTATARVAFDPSGNLYIDRVLRRRMEYPDQRRAILALIADEPDTEHFIEASANGNAVIQDLRREPRLAARRFRGVKVTESKTARAFTWNALAEEGRVFLVRGVEHGLYRRSMLVPVRPSRRPDRRRLDRRKDGTGAEKQNVCFLDPLILPARIQRRSAAS